jgi:hypothetical protein
MMIVDRKCQVDYDLRRQRGRHKSESRHVAQGLA